MKLGVVALQAWQLEIKDFTSEEKKAMGIQSPEEKKREDLKSKLVGMTKDEIIAFVDSTILK